MTSYLTNEGCKPNEQANLQDELLYADDKNILNREEDARSYDRVSQTFDKYGLNISSQTNEVEWGGGSVPASTRKHSRL